MPTLTPAEMIAAVRDGRAFPRIGNGPLSYWINGRAYGWDAAAAAFVSPF